MPLHVTHVPKWFIRHPFERQKINLKLFTSKTATFANENKPEFEASLIKFVLSLIL